MFLVVVLQLQYHLIKLILKYVNILRVYPVLFLLPVLILMLFIKRFLGVHVVSMYLRCISVLILMYFILLEGFVSVIISYIDFFSLRNVIS